MDLEISWMIGDWMDQCAEIDKESFDDPWDADAIRRACMPQSSIGLVAREGSFVVGFIIYDSCGGLYYIQRLAVRRVCRRIGVATALVEKLLNKNRPRIYADVPERCDSAVKLFQSLGFVADSVLRGQFGPFNDGIAMEWNVGIRQADRVGA